MRLKCIKLAGFKSFVDPTTIDFPSNLCSVVGPNGCGKSNVIDAVRWVMGESSAKNLRGENMTDVIFNGSGGRKPVGQASVELVFDNHDHKLTGEYANFDEVSIKRKVDRDAQSTYSLNGTKCRRKDVTDIFLGTGLGARSYSIIEQGMVSRLIESKPEELRVFIEEAAGISKYKERRKETESRIKRTRENLERLSDIRDELGRQLAHLQRQSVAAEKYGEYKAQERQTTAYLNALKWQALDVDIKQNKAAIGDQEVKLEATIAEQREADARIEQRLVDGTELADKLGEVQARFYSLGNDIARLEQSIEHHLERADQMRFDLSETQQAYDQTREELDTDLSRIVEIETELEEVSPELDSALELAAESAAILEDAESGLRQWQTEWDAFNESAERPRQVAEVEQARIQQLENIVQRGLERSRRLDEERAQLLQSDEDETVIEAREELALLEETIEKLQAQSQLAGSEIALRRSEYSECADQLDAARSELQTARGKLASLEALQQAALGLDNEEVNIWLRSNGLGDRQRLAESIRIEAGWEQAVESVLGETLQSICVEGLDDIEALLAELPEGRIALVDVKTKASDKLSTNLALKPLGEFVQADSGIRDLLQGIYAAESLTEALAQRLALGSHESIVTPDGLWLGRSWIQLKTADKEGSIVKRRGLIEELNELIDARLVLSNQLNDRQIELKEAIAEAEQAREQLQLDIAANSKAFGNLKSQLSAQQAKVEEAGLRRQRIHHELEELKRQIELEQENIAESRQRLQVALDSMEENIEAREALEQRREQHMRSQQASREKARNDKDLAHSLALRQQTLQSQLQSTRATMDRMSAQVNRSQERIEFLTTQIATSEEPVADMRAELESLLEKRLDVEQELAQAKAQVDANEHAIRGLEAERNSIQERSNQIREVLMQARLKSEGASVKQEAILEQLTAAKFNLEAVLNALPEELDVEQCDAELERLATRIQRLGPINLAAIDEYAQQSERKVYLDKQNEDLERALTTLQNAIKKIDQETRARFKETFDKVNAGLQALFPRVFGGGHAYLDMTGEDLLDTGVAIMARPPGKRNSTIHLLSGGEKAMTAIALVFSIFQLNPSPFCMLDEVDAPLDDANVGRYANLVKEMSKSVQFIFITHNKITMEMANQLLGVTMHEPGVSRIVAVDIEEAAELAAM